MFAKMRLNWGSRESPKEKHQTKAPRSIRIPAPYVSAQTQSHEMLNATSRYFDGAGTGVDGAAPVVTPDDPFGPGVTLRIGGWPASGVVRAMLVGAVGVLLAVWLDWLAAFKP